MYGEPRRDRDRHADTDPDSYVLSQKNSMLQYTHCVPVNLHPLSVVMLGFSPVERAPNDDPRVVELKCLLWADDVVVILSKKKKKKRYTQFY